MKLFYIQFIKDFRANFSNFNAYIVLSIYYILSVFSAIYLGDYFLRETDVMNAFFAVQPVILTFVIPGITMRSWAEEIKSGTIELLLTQPIGYMTLIIAKFFASFVFFILLVISSLFLSVFSSWFSFVDIGGLCSQYLGLILVGALFCAIGVSVSIFNKNNILSYTATIFILFSVTQMSFTNIGNLKLYYLNFEDNYNAFLSGVVSIGNILYFVFGIIMFVWINLFGIYFRKAYAFKERISLGVFLGILMLIFGSVQLGSSLCFNKEFDITDEKKYTLKDETQKILKLLDKRIDITLYLSKNARNDANSSYSVFADFVEKTLKQFEKKSDGLVRTNTILVEPFGELERRLVKDGVYFEEDKLGYKKFMAIEIADNNGNFELIKSFNSLRQNLLESDITRIIKSFGLEKKKIMLLANNDILEKMSVFRELVDRFYDVTIVDKLPPFILPSFDSVLVFGLNNVSSENLLALEQYVLRGGNLVVIGESDVISLISQKHIVNFLKSFGINPVVSDEPIATELNNQKVYIGASQVIYDKLKDGVRSVLVNSANEIKFENREKSKFYPIVRFMGKNIAGFVEGQFVSEYLDLAYENKEILPSSIKDGRVFFIYDMDLFMDYIYVSDETKNNYYYDIVTTSDNQLFMIRLLDFATNSNIESDISYRHYLISAFSIGNTILSQVKEKYSKDIKILEEKLVTTQNKRDNFYNVLTAKGFASVKNIGELSEFEQIIDETEDELNKTKLLIASEYQTIIVGFTAFLILVVPFVYLILLFIVLSIYKKLKLQKFREAMNDI